MRHRVKNEATKPCLPSLTSPEDLERFKLMHSKQKSKGQQITTKLSRFRLLRDPHFPECQCLGLNRRNTMEQSPRAYSIRLPYNPYETEI